MHFSEQKRILGIEETRCVMQPPDVMFLEVFIVAVALIVFGAVLPEVSVLLWIGIVLTIGIGTWWTVNKVHRHGSHY